MRFGVMTREGPAYKCQEENVPNSDQGTRNKKQKPENMRPKPSYRRWARWAGYDCGE